ncbi:hypothetical protein BDN67DRAFT_587125 [Paxillus ammoniavirescens]|nr:hypothetical protein BDN67DRAFT_587125 [Paxillus ammoniavirescens]
MHIDASPETRLPLDTQNYPKPSIYPASLLTTSQSTQTTTHPHRNGSSGVASGYPPNTNISHFHRYIEHVELQLSRSNLGDLTVPRTSIELELKHMRGRAHGSPVNTDPLMNRDRAVKKKPTKHAPLYCEHHRHRTICLRTLGYTPHPSRLCRS